MKPLLIQLQKSFTAYELANVTNLGVYAVRFYELLKQYESIGQRQLGFEELKLMFELEDKYPLFSGFYTFVVEPAVKEINEFTDLHIRETEKIKEGKKIVALRFHFYKTTPKFITQQPVILDDSTVVEHKKVFENSFIDSNSTSTNADKRFQQYYGKVVENLGVTPTVYLNLLKQYSDEQFEQAIRVTFRAKSEGQIKTNPSGFFIQALKKGYTDVKEEGLKKQKKEDTSKHRAEQIALLQAEKENRIFERIKELTSHNPALTIQAIEALKFTDAGKKAILEEERQHKRLLEVEDFRQIKPLRNLVIETLFVGNIEKFADILEDFDANMKRLT